MTERQGAKAWRSKDGSKWRIGRHAEIAWIEEGTESGLAITSAIPPVFEAYATLEEPHTEALQVSRRAQEKDLSAVGIDRRRSSV
jgi:hypothetical protein